MHQLHQQHIFASARFCKSIADLGRAPLASTSTLLQPLVYRDLGGLMMLSPPPLAGEERVGVCSGSRFGQFFLIAPRKRHCCLGLRGSRGKKRIVRLQCSPLQAARQHRRTGPSQNGCGCSSVDRVLASEAKGRGFDPRQPRQPCSLHAARHKAQHPQRARQTSIGHISHALRQGVLYGHNQSAHLSTIYAGNGVKCLEDTRMARVGMPRHARAMCVFCLHWRQRGQRPCLSKIATNCCFLAENVALS